ncbi:hypothetical protein WICMUC_005076 [Wickerhamomyces mucosus]|uniref:Uncharacterized protein n=1 Tax=Wickerhamomyces mucosus TaxID=1378264 RepID=A0A9P8PC18_9ASCO|nr:hypothetical protein WICMUC_005076 [Wickerhamomyces mucosus]
MSTTQQNIIKSFSLVDLNTALDKYNINKELMSLYNISQIEIGAFKKIENKKFEDKLKELRINKLKKYKTVDRGSQFHKVQGEINFDMPNELKNTRFGVPLISSSLILPTLQRAEYFDIGFPILSSTDEEILDLPSEAPFVLKSSVLLPSCENQDPEHISHLGESQEILESSSGCQESYSLKHQILSDPILDFSSTQSFPEYDETVNISYIDNNNSHRTNSSFNEQSLFSQRVGSFKRTKLENENTQDIVTFDTSSSS